MLSIRSLLLNISGLKAYTGNSSSCGYPILLGTEKTCLRENKHSLDTTFREAYYYNKNNFHNSNH
jgi:hypothetical protein